MTVGKWPCPHPGPPTVAWPGPPSIDGCRCSTCNPIGRRHCQASNDPCFVDQVQDRDRSTLEATGARRRAVREREAANPGMGENPAHAALGTG